MWMEINSACILFCIHFIDFISQPSGASVKTNKSLQLSDESWSVSIASACLEITNMHSQICGLYHRLLKDTQSDIVSRPSCY